MSALRIIKQYIGQATDTAKNFLWDASAADGTLKLKRESGQEIISVDSAGKVSMPQNAQTWQDVKASRLFGTTYTNNTGQPIDVSLQAAQSTGVNQVLGVTVGGVTITSISTFSGTTVGTYFRVPAGATYVVTVTGTHTINYWAELR